MTRLLANWIMKNEAANLPRMLKSIEPVIVGAAVTDTGSTDNSIQLVAEFFRAHHKPVFINRAPFENFAQARNAALRHARGLTAIDWDYLLFVDCDHELITNGNKLPVRLSASAYSILQDNGNCRYWNVRAMRRDQTGEYEGVTHECLSTTEAPVAIGGWYYRDHETGANRVDKYTRDVRLLMEALRQDPANPRLMFYMITSLHGAGMFARAREFCDLRLKLEGHPEEVFWTLFNRAQFSALLKYPRAQVKEEFLQAYNNRPWRAEPLIELAALHRNDGEPAVGLLYAREAAHLPLPAMEVLPVLQPWYEWRALDEWLVCAVEAGNMVEARMAAKQLPKRKLPPEHRRRILDNCNTVLRKGKRVQATAQLDHEKRGSDPAANAGVS